MLGLLSILLGFRLLLRAGSANGFVQPPEDCRNVTQATEVLDAIQNDPTLEKSFCLVGGTASCVTVRILLSTARSRVFHTRSLQVLPARTHCHL